MLLRGASKREDQKGQGSQQTCGEITRGSVISVSAIHGRGDHIHVSGLDGQRECEFATHTPESTLDQVPLACCFVAARNENESLSTCKRTNQSIG
jgi:hypothetical protein